MMVRRLIESRRLITSFRLDRRTNGDTRGSSQPETYFNKNSFPSPIWVMGPMERGEIDHSDRPGGGLRIPDISIESLVEMIVSK